MLSDSNTLDRRLDPDLVVIFGTMPVNETKSAGSDVIVGRLPLKILDHGNIRGGRSTGIS